MDIRVMYGECARLLEHAAVGKWMDSMHEDEDVVLNAKAVLLAVGGAALAGLLFVLARRDEPKEPAARAEAAVEDVKKGAKKAAKAAKKKREEFAAVASETGDRLAHEIRDRSTPLGVDAKAAERELKAAAWDAQQEAMEAESQLRAAGHRVVDDASHLASRFGAEARNLAGEGRERIAHLRHREDAESEIVRLRAEIDELREQLSGSGRRAEKDYAKIVSRLAGKGSPVSEVMASQAVAAALAQLERSFKAKAPALLAAKNRAQVMEILQQELGPTLRDTAVQAAAAALGMWETAREQGAEPSEARDRAREAAKEVRDAARESAREARDAAKSAADEARGAVEEAAEAIRSNGKHRFWRSHDHGQEPLESVHERVQEAVENISAAASPEEERRSKAGLFWGGAGLGLALYALLDAERREQVLRLANEASIQVQELVRDLQGYDDEF